MLIFLIWWDDKTQIVERVRHLFITNRSVFSLKKCRRKEKNSSRKFFVEIFRKFRKSFDTCHSIWAEDRRHILIYFHTSYFVTFKVCCTIDVNHRFVSVFDVVERRKSSNLRIRFFPRRIVSKIFFLLFLLCLLSSISFRFLDIFFKWFSLIGKRNKTKGEKRNFFIDSKEKICFVFLYFFPTGTAELKRLSEALNHLRPMPSSSSSSSKDQDAKKESNKNKKVRRFCLSNFDDFQFDVFSSDGCAHSVQNKRRTRW